MTPEESGVWYGVLGVIRNLKMTPEERLLSIAMVATSQVNPSEELNADALCRDIGLDPDTMQYFLYVLDQEGIIVATRR